MGATTIHGRGGMLYLQGSGAQATKLANARSWKITIDKAEDEDNALGDSWVTQKIGLLRYTGSISGNLDTAARDVYEAAISTTEKKFYFYPVASTTTSYYYGSAHFKLDVDLQLTGVVRFTADFIGEGQLGYN